MRASAMLHLPGLALAGQMEKVVRAVSQLGFQSAAFGEGSDATGSVFQISNQQTLGESEEDILKKLTVCFKPLSSKKAKPATAYSKKIPLVCSIN